MMKYEVKKIFSKPTSKIATILLCILVGVISFLTIHGVYYVNEQGVTEYGYAAIQELKSEKKNWEGELDKEQLKKVISENEKINQSDIAQSSDITDNNIIYAQKQGFSDIREMINQAFSAFQEYNYYTVDSVSTEEVENLYSNRISSLENWLNTDAKDQFSNIEKSYLLKQYNNLEVPLYYNYADGWKQFLEYATTIIMITVLIIGYLVSGIFSSEFQLNADSVFFSTFYGRKKAIRAKIFAGILLITLIYWVTMFLYSCIVFGVFGLDGGSCAIQTSLSGWKSMYNITYFQEYILIILGGYIGALFISAITMLVSAKTQSTVIAVLTPFVIIFVPSFLSSIPVLDKILGLLPDELLQLTTVIQNFNLYEIGNKVIAAVPILLILYIILFFIILPFIYRIYRKVEIK